MCSYRGGLRILVAFPYTQTFSPHCIVPPQEIGMKLTEISPRGVHAVFETLRSVLHSGRVNARVQYMIEVMFAIRKDKFQVAHHFCLGVVHC